MTRRKKILATSTQRHAPDRMIVHTIFVLAMDFNPSIEMVNILEDKVSEETVASFSFETG